MYLLETSQNYHAMFHVLSHNPTQHTLDTYVYVYVYFIVKLYMIICVLYIKWYSGTSVKGHSQ